MDALRRSETGGVGNRVRRFDDLTIVRDVRRTTTKSDGPTVAQEAA